MKTIIKQILMSLVLMVISLVLLSYEKNEQEVAPHIKGTKSDKQTTLFHNYQSAPFLATKSNTWYSMHIANATILSPEETKDTKWRMYVRGTSMYLDGKHDDIGLFYQEANDFNPVGKWKEYEHNPVLTHGPAGSYDAKVVLDGSAVAVPGKKIIIYYKGRVCMRCPGSVNGAFSIDGGFAFTKFSNNPLKIQSGPNEVKYVNNKYYLFYGHDNHIWLSISDAPDKMSDNPTEVINVGPPGSFDSRAVNGAKVFKVSGDNRWFLIYQCSSKHGDFPERFHCAYSDDLVHWTKVNNDIPLFMRGNAGQWDQGAIWTGDVIEYKDSLYIYYEGWGVQKAVKDRDAAYFPEGKSQIGVATAKVEDFLNWVKKN